jgi:hypothetical protein
MSMYRRDRRFGLFEPHRMVPRPHLPTPAGRFALLCLGPLWRARPPGFAK